MRRPRSAPVDVLRVDGGGCSVDDVGGKAFGLDRLAAHGFPIPATFAVTAGAYREAVASAGIEAWLRELGRRPIPEPAGLAAEVAEVEAVFGAIPLGRDLRDAVEAAAGELLADGPVAVRSSATAEDMGIASFAGQYRTFTRVHDVAAVIDALKRCWASLWLPTAREYRMRHRIPSEDLAMGAIVQSMVDADWSGVAFTVDPTSDAPVMRVELVPGLGEALVSGRVTPLDFTIRRDTLEIEGGDATREHPNCLEDLARMILQVEDKLDEPQDIEWASVDDRIVLLQSRPVTVVGPRSVLDDGFDGPTRSDDEFTPLGIVEMLPGVVSPLLWTINAPMVEHGYRAVVAGLGADPGPSDRPFVGRFRGRAALNLSALRDVAESLPGGSAADVERQFLGHTVSEDPADTGGKSAGIRSLFRSRRADKRLDDEVDLVVAASDAIVGFEADLDTVPAWRLAGYHRTVRDLAWRATSAEVAASGAASGAYRALEVLLERWLAGPDAAMWAQRLTAGTLGRHAAGGRLDRDLADALRCVQLDDRAMLELIGAEPSRVRGRVRGLGDAGRLLETAVNAAARRAGSRSVYGGPTWDEVPDLVWQRLHLVASQLGDARGTPRPGRPIDELTAVLRTARSWNLIRIVTGQIVDLRIRWIEHAARDAARALRRRERAKSALLTLGGEERRLIIEIGNRICNSRQLHDIDDVAYLADDELRAMLTGSPAPSVADLHWRDAAARRAQSAGPLPDLFPGTPDAVGAASTGRPTALGSATLTGWPASPGTVEGRARVIDGVDDAGRLRPGDVLVAIATDPSWTPIIVGASALVLETGGPLSHAAIVAREFGIPAVLKVRDATRLIDDDETIAVDGYAGSVTRVPSEVEAT